MKEPIVVGVNDSEASDEAVVWATRRAATLKRPVLLVHAVDDQSTYDYQIPEYIEMLRKTGRELLKKAKTRAVVEEPSVEVATKIVSGSPGHVLRKWSRGASMVVIGSGHAWLGGPVTDRALQIAAVARCPVAVIGERDVRYGQGVLVGVDGSEESTQAVAFAAAEADRSGQELTVLHAFRSPTTRIHKAMPESNYTKFIQDEERVVLAETAAGLGIKYPDLVIHQVLESDKDSATAISQAASNARLLVLGSRGRGSFKRLLLGSTAHAVLAQLPCPTIITRVRPNKRSK